MISILLLHPQQNLNNEQDGRMSKDSELDQEFRHLIMLPVGPPDMPVRPTPRAVVTTALQLSSMTRTKLVFRHA